MGGKVFVYDASAKIPLIIYDPRLNKDTKVDKSNELVALVDIAPTVLDLAGVSIPDEMQGRSVKPLMRGQETDWRQELFLENMMTIQNYPRIEAVRTHDWKYIRYFDREKDQAYSDMLVASINGEESIYEELFDLTNDPHETHNVIEVAANSEIVAELNHRTSELVKEYRGTLPANTHSYWERVFSDPGEGEWQENWFVEGKKATVEYDDESLLFRSGPVPMEQASHAVLWTKQNFEGDIRIEYDYTRVDSMTEAPSVNILYIQTTGLGTDESPTDIYFSTEQREVPWMKSYFLNMNALHISYATTGPKRADYVAARRYPAKDQGSFMNGTMIQPIYEDVHLFEPGETYHITATKEGNRLTFTAERDGKTNRFEWDTSAFPPVTEGRVGFRHMWARSSRYENIKVFQK